MLPASVLEFNATRQSLFSNLPKATEPGLPAILATEAEAARRLRMGLGFGKVGGAFGLAFAAFFLAIGHYWGSLVVALCTAGFIANRLVIKRGRLALAGNLYALLLTIGFALLTAIEGGLGGHAIAWLACVPICASLFSGPRAGARWCVACLGAVGAFSLVSCLGYHVPTLYPERWTTLVSAAGYLALTLFMSALGILFETSRQRTFQELGKTLELLADEHAALARSMEELRRSEARFRSLFENSALGIALLDGQGQVQTGNDRLAELLGVSQADGFDLGAAMCAQQRNRLLETLNRHDASSPIPVVGVDSTDAEEFILKLPGRGGKRIFRCSLSGLPGSGQQCVMIDDITQQRALERGAAQQEKSALLDTLIGGIAHEINNKLTPVAGFTELMLDRANAGEFPAKWVAYFRIIHNGAIEAGRIISQLLELSRPPATEMQGCGLRGIVEEIGTVLTFRLRETGSQLLLRLPPEDVVVHGDEGQIKQVVLNLALNALDAMAGSDERQLCLEIAELDGQGVLSVIDTGCGMTPQEQARIFDPFYTTKGNEGTGLGLSVCAGIIRSHGGEIVVDSELGKGTRFDVSLPLGLFAPTAKAAAAINKTGENGLRGRRALIVDDEENIAKVVQAILQGQGCEGVCATSLAEAIGRLGKENFDLVVTDLRLGDGTGLELWKWLRVHRPGLAAGLVVISGDAGSSGLCAELNRLSVPLLHKPFTQKDLVKKVEKVWAQARVTPGRQP